VSKARNFFDIEMVYDFLPARTSDILSKFTAYFRLKAFFDVDGNLRAPRIT
jgi:hypothetical protein